MRLGRHPYTGVNGSSWWVDVTTVGSAAEHLPSMHARGPWVEPARLPGNDCVNDSRFAKHWKGKVTVNPCLLCVLLGFFLKINLNHPLHPPANSGCGGLLFHSECLHSSLGTDCWLLPQVVSVTAALGSRQLLSSIPQVDSSVTAALAQGRIGFTLRSQRRKLMVPGMLG